ncbi:MAG: hypothetical protein FJZ93_05345 [Chloroflexi bacterium]|nr:hypothetical protein [Chloroflexota bacterium]MBM4450880.1 hypothetical protein [Chloroflexota bacterium]
MLRRLYGLCLATMLVLASSLLIFPTPAIADGGPFVGNRELWKQLEEGQQTAVVTLGSNNTAHVDLFISLLDNSGESHQVVFFLPLGTEASGFKVVEKNSLDFDRELTKKLDEALRIEAERRSDVRFSLVAGSLLINGGWALPLTALLAWIGCGPAAAPEATFETDSSRVDIYGVNENTDLDDLINATGLDPAVKDTLSRLRGQKIAVVTLQTQPPAEDGDSPDKQTGQPGIHLAWTTRLVFHSTEATYAYPLGTGAAWAHPIEMTGVYVVAPPGVDFAVEYPKLGIDQSGYEGMPFGQLKPTITSYRRGAAYAVDEATGDFGRIWRAVYTQSNSAQDIVIVVGRPAGLAASLQKPFLGLGVMATLVIGSVLALLLWVIAWRLCIPPLLKREYRFGSSRLWLESLVCPGINAAILLVVTLVTGLYVLLAALESGFVFIVTLILILLVPIAGLATLGVPGVWLSFRRHLRSSGVSAGRTIVAYIVVTTVANTAYAALAIGYAALTGVL